VEGKPTGRTEVRLVSVVRVGEVVMMLYEIGWEGTSADRAVVDHFTELALGRVQAWIG
jgi:hypothetical protein